jgi:D-sedoheptulose 7-phosphate isomerase
VSVNLMRAIDLAKARAEPRSSRHCWPVRYTTAKQGDVVVIPEVNPARVTPLSEGMQAIIWHCLVSHPNLQVRKTKW